MSVILLILDIIALLCYIAVIALQMGHYYSMRGKMNGELGGRRAFILYIFCILILTVSITLADGSVFNPIMLRIVSRVFLILSSLISILLYSGSKFKFLT